MAVANSIDYYIYRSWRSAQQMAESVRDDGYNVIVCTRETWKKIQENVAEAGQRGRSLFLFNIPVHLSVSEEGLEPMARALHFEFGKKVAIIR